MLKIKRIVLLLILMMPVLIFSQVKELMYDDYCDNNYITDIEEDDEGNIVYIGKYYFDEESTNSPFIVKLSPEGKVLNRVVFETEDLIRYTFESLDITEQGTYLISGNESDKFKSSLTVMEFDKDLNQLWKKSYVIDDYKGENRQTKVLQNILKKMSDGNYIMTFLEIVRRNIDTYSNQIIKFSPTFDSILMPDKTVGGKFCQIDILPNVTDGNLYLIEQSIIYVLNYSTLELKQTEDLTDSRGGCEVSGYELTDGRIILGSLYDDYVNGYNSSFLSVCEVDKINYEITKISMATPVKKKGVKYIHHGSEKNSMSFIDEDNFIVGGTMNIYSSSADNSLRPYMTKPSTLAVACFDKDLNLKWETFYEDGETSYYMMSMCATRDKGAIAAVIKCRPEQAVESKGDIVILKFDPHPDAVKEVIEKEIVELYPNPACGSVTIDMGDCQEDCFVEVYDISGKLCMSDVILSDYGKKDMDVSKLQNGFYMVKINSGSEPAVTVKLSIKR